MPDRPTQLPAGEEKPSFNGLRMTKQRREVYDLLLETRNHPTAQDIFLGAKERMPTISLATVYNCLEALVQHDLVRQVNFDREPSRYCPNLSEHGHFHDEKTGTIHDVTFREGATLADFLNLPEGTDVSSFEITLRGTLPN